ncbi:unnamed protein product, partial [Mesorhabditis belari]|uniref:Uncharacterized protein n=1 Tax=Mesorhabditis belari TaxID=2138241 RepID=A0AAF3EMI9_9BILA
MSISSTSKQSSLENCDDICLVCNDQSSGYHYGIPSCNGCKTFFRRAIVQNLTFICQLGGKCSVDKTVRCACRFCRLKKCIDMGMDKNAIQNNREPIGYTKRSRKKKLSFAQDDQQPSTSKETLSPLDSPETFPELDRLVTIEKRLQKLRIGILNVPTELETALLSERLLENEGFIEKNGREFKSPFFQRYFTEEDASFWIDRDATLMLEWIKCLLGGQELDVEDLTQIIYSSSINLLVLLWTYYSKDTKEDRIVFPNGAWFDTGQKQETSLFVSERSQLINGILKDIRKLEFDEVEMVAFRALLALNSNIEELTSKGREIIEKNRSSIALSIHQYLEQKMGGFLEADERQWFSSYISLNFNNDKAI